MLIVIANPAKKLLFTRITILLLFKNTSPEIICAE